MIKNKKDIPPYPILIDLTGPDGNVFVLMGKAKGFGGVNYRSYITAK